MAVHTKPPAKTGVYGDDLSRPVDELINEIRSTMVKARGRLHDIGFHDALFKQRLEAVTGLLTCGIVVLYGESEYAKKIEVDRRAIKDGASSHTNGE